MFTGRAIERLNAVGWSADTESLLRPLQRAHDPDAALEQFLTFLEANTALAELAGTEPDLTVAFIAVYRASRAMTTMLGIHPEWLMSFRDDPVEASEVLDGAALRRFVQGRLVRTAVRDLLGLADMPAVGRELADTADAASHAALTIATSDTRNDPRYQTLPEVPFSVIAMGKWGAQELNYASDIDVLFVYDNPTGTDPDLTRSYANQIAAGFVAALADVTADGIAYRVDTDLRPEGRNGPLTRSLASYAALSLIHI